MRSKSKSKEEMIRNEMFSQHSHRLNARTPNSTMIEGPEYSCRTAVIFESKHNGQVLLLVQLCLSVGNELQILASHPCRAFPIADREIVCVA